MTLRRYSLLTCALLLAACSSDKAGIDPAKLIDFQPTAKIEVRWQHSLGDSGINVLTPGVTRVAVFGASDEYLYRFDRDTGKQMWRIKPGFTISGGVGAGEGLVLVGGDQGELAAFDETDGKLRWQVQVSSEVLSAPKIASGIVVVRTGNGRIAGLNADDGKRLWLYERVTPALSVRSHAGVTIRNGMVYAGFAAGRLAAIGLTKGVVIWEATVSQPRGNTELERISDITSLPVADDRQVCAIAFQGRLVCFDAIQGNTLWTREMSSDKGLALFGGNLYVTDADGTVFALDRSSGATLWKNDQNAYRRVTAPYPFEEYIVVGDFEGYLHVFNTGDGGLLARRKTDGSAILSAPVVMGDGALVQTSDGELLAISVQK
ncbi:MAG: outer membrane protein assembly factor BamB [Gammaproteobacteria bacterium]|nr:outer membrane protein assembly factor BamB [Gammaproteobacteria bacterium]MBU1625299.1 outer membrane protein assembly factor BamB [Gammaproteobacteria bacterium]MBU1981559.1 outer membrane protein assembly factor BamB [Gammaproteobacteria bacterium]